MKLTRRTFILATSACLGSSVTTGASELSWEGYAMGAEARLIFSGVDRRRAEAALQELLGEVARLERSFSLYRRDSELVRLNGDGVLDSPTEDFRLLLNMSLDYWRGTQGAFNPAVQPIWKFLGAHFSVSAEPPRTDELMAVARRCDPSCVEVSSARIRLKPGMALTFNGIAQGYITDRAVEILKRHGLDRTLAGFGEFRALPGKAWRMQPGQLRRRVSLENAAIATSAGSATQLSADGRWHHLIDPHTGRSVNSLDAVSVIADTATEADALATAYYVASSANRGAIAARYSRASFFWADHDAEK